MVRATLWLLSRKPLIRKICHNLLIFVAQGEGGFVEGLLDSENAGKVFKYKYLSISQVDPSPAHIMDQFFDISCLKQFIDISCLKQVHLNS